MTQRDELSFKIISEVVYKPQSFLKKKKDILRNSLEIEKEIKQTEQSQSRNDPDTLEPDIYI